MPQKTSAPTKRTSPALPNVCKTSPIIKSSANRKTRAHLKSQQTAAVDSIDKILLSATLTNKQSGMIQLMLRPIGVSMAELKKMSGWQAHSIRGVISGSLRKKLGLVVIHFKSDAGESCYRIDTIHAVEISGGK